TLPVQLNGQEEGRIMQLLSALNKLIKGDEQTPVQEEQDERLATRPMQSSGQPDERTRPSPRISDQRWLQIQKAIDQAG
ncbi:MAG: hypothetical protein AB1801_06170, partial [Chloroflexota bacterium]